MFRHFLISFLFLFIFSISFSQEDNRQHSPNVVVIFMDDLGYGDLVSYGAMDIQTPNLDKLAMEGMRFTNFLAAQAVCSASRAALLTGCYPNRIGVHGAYNSHAKVGLSADEMTIAELLKQKDYATAVFGKWHLGHHKQFLPLQHGFDEFVGLPYSNDMWPVGYDGKPATNFKADYYPPLPLIEGNEAVDTIDDLDDQGELTKIYTENAVEFIEENKKRPFFLYLPHTMVHVPIAASEEFEGSTGKGLWADVMAEVDWSVGEIMNTLKENGLEENTILIFTSDNGPWLNYGNHQGATAGLREGKGTTYEGGQRVPAIMKWKGVIPQGVVSNQLSSTIDILPTLAAITNTSLPAHKIDGVDLSPLLKGDMNATPRTYFNYYYRYNNLEAVRMGNWKLVFPHYGRTYKDQKPGKDGFPGPSLEQHFEPEALYDLRRDPGEEYDVQLAHPEIYRQLKEYAEKVRKDLGDDLTDTEGTGRRPFGKLAEGE